METPTRISFDRLRTAAKALSPEQRGLLLDELALGIGETESSDSPEAIAAVWDSEIENRLLKVECGETVEISAEEADSRLREQLDWLG